LIRVCDGIDEKIKLEKKTLSGNGVL